MNPDRQVVDAILRNRLVPFIHRSFQTVAPGQIYQHNWHIDAVAHHLELCRRRAIRRLIIAMPPRNLKSICASVAFPAFALGHDPTLRIIAVSYAQDLAVKHARDCRTVMESGWYRSVFPRSRINPRKNTEAEFETIARGFRLTTSVGGIMTGRGGNIIIIDDPMKPDEAMSEAKREAVNQWYDATLTSRLDSKKDDVIIMVMQRLHVDDLIGHVLEKADWTYLNLPAIADTPQDVPIGDGRVYHRGAGEVLHPAREPRHVLMRLKADMGSQAFSAQYQQAPVPPGGALIKWSWFKTYANTPVRRANDLVVQSWDTASKVADGNDWSVCTTWLVQGTDYYLLDVLRERLEYPDLKRRIVAHAAKHSATAVLIEDAGSGMPLIQELKRDGTLKPIPIRPEGDKVMRAAAQTVAIEAGHVLLPEQAPWLGDFRTEVMAFPHGRFDDQVDSLSQFLQWVTARRRNYSIPGPVSITRSRSMSNFAC